MTHIAIIIGLILLSGLCYRARGSGWTASDISIKGLRYAKLAVGALPIAVACWLLGVNPLLCLGVWLLCSCADSLPHGAWQGTSSPGQVAMLILVSVAVMIPAALALGTVGLYPALAALACGALCGPATWAANKIPVHFSIGPLGFNQGPEVGEFARGVVRVLFVFA